MIIERRGYRKEYDENGILISKTPIAQAADKPVEETVDVESDEELGDE